jgi:hypothetical protein
MNLFKEVVKKYGIGTVLGAATLDGYRRAVINDRNNNVLNKIDEAQSTLQESERLAYQQRIEEQAAEAPNKATLDRFKTAADDHQKSTNDYNSNQNSINLAKMEEAKKKLDKSYEEISKNNIGEIFTDLYNKYNEYLANLTPDKIVCLFNIILDGLIFSSFLSVLSIMLSENIINRLKFLENYPKLFKLLQLRNNINKKVSKIYLGIHVIMISLAFLGNVYMFFI